MILEPLDELEAKGFKFPCDPQDAFERYKAGDKRYAYAACMLKHASTKQIPSWVGWIAVIAQLIILAIIIWYANIHGYI